MKIIIIGPPCVGKGTVCRLLEQHTGYKHISIGQALRSTYTVDTLIGKHISAGGMVTNEIITPILNLYTKQNIILDGFPRTIGQIDMIHEMEDDQTHIYILTASKSILIERMLKRKICETCEEEATENICEVKDCNGTVIKRPDDTIEIYEKRYQTYMQNIDDIKEQLSNFVEIDTSNQTPIAICNQILTNITQTNEF